MAMPLAMVPSTSAMPPILMTSYKNSLSKVREGKNVVCRHEHVGQVRLSLRDPYAQSACAKALLAAARDKSHKKVPCHFWLVL